MSCGVCTSTRWHQLCHARNSKTILTSGMKHHPRLAHINHGLWLGDISYGLHASFWKSRPNTTNIRHDLHTSNVVCANLASDVNKWYAMSSKACIHNLCHVCISWTISILVNNTINKTRLVRFRKATSADNKKHQPRHAAADMERVHLVVFVGE